MYNESRKKATMKYLKTQKQIRFWVNPVFYDQVKTAAAAGGFSSLRQFYIFAVEDLIQKIRGGFRVSGQQDLENNVADGVNIE